MNPTFLSFRYVNNPLHPRQTRKQDKNLIPHRAMLAKCELAKSVVANDIIRQDAPIPYIGGSAIKSLRK